MEKYQEISQKQCVGERDCRSTAQETFALKVFPSILPKLMSTLHPPMAPLPLPVSKIPNSEILNIFHIKKKKEEPALIQTQAIANLFTSF